MRIFIAVLLFILSLTATLPAQAAQIANAAPKATNDAPQEPPLAAISSADRLDGYFTQLKRTRDPIVAGELTAKIWAVWNDSGSATVNLLIHWANEDMAKQKYPAALDFLDQAIALKPDYAEAWNKRATLHYHAGNYKKSMEDIAHVLALEPRHFGALSGMATILEESGKDEAAMRMWERLLDVYPADRESQNHLKTLSEKLDGSRT
jgi:tetratricopeptide (TPR) repeat protein